MEVGRNGCGLGGDALRGHRFHLHKGQCCLFAVLRLQLAGTFVGTHTGGTSGHDHHFYSTTSLNDSSIEPARRLLTLITCGGSLRPSRSTARKASPAQCSSTTPRGGALASTLSRARLGRCPCIQQPGTSGSACVLASLHIRIQRCRRATVKTCVH